MKKFLPLIMLLLGMILLSACEADPVSGGGTLPDHAQGLITEVIKNERFDETGGRVVYVKEAPSEGAGENLWCVHVRYINTQGLFTSPLLVSQQGEDWRVERSPSQPTFESYGCQWPASD